MQETQQLTGEEFKDLVDVFRVLRKWRDERNTKLMEGELVELPANEGAEK